MRVPPPSPLLRGSSPLLRRIARQRWLWRHRAAFRDEDLRRPPRLYVDLSVIIRHDARTGIQRVVRAVWLQLRRLAGSHLEVVPVFAGTTHGYCHAPPDFLDHADSIDQRGSTAIPAADRPVGMRRGDIFLGLDLAAHLLPRHGAQLGAWRAAGASVHLLVYDLLPVTNPRWFNPATRRNFGDWVDALGRYADGAICISDHVAGELRGWLAAHPTASGRGPRIRTIRLGSDIAASVPTAGLAAGARDLLDRMRRNATVLMVGTVEPRKGYDAALDAFEHLWRSHPGVAPDLVIAGKPGWRTAALQERLRGHPDHGRRLQWLESVSDEYLERLYGASTALLMASYAEGYGLPLVEAANHRLPVLARDLSVFREHGLAGIAYFDDDAPAALADKLMTAISAPVVAAAAAACVPLPTWSDCAHDLMLAIGAPMSRHEEAAPAAVAM